MMEVDPLHAIKHRINAGDREGARLELNNLLETDPDNVDAWALLAILLTEPAEQARCYHQILRIDPQNRLAAAWLEALARVVPAASAQELEPGRETEERPMVQSPLGERPSAQAHDEWVPPTADELQGLLEELKHTKLDDQALRQLLEQDLATQPDEQMLVPPAARVEKRSFLDRVLGRGGTETQDATRMGDTTDRPEALVQTGRLGPGEIIRLAGGPLSPEERRKCPGCGAIVSRSETRCPWCSEYLSSSGDE